MARLKYLSDNSKNREVQEIEFKFSDTLDLKEIRIIFIRMIHALGYSPKNISDVFGPIDSSTYNVDDFFIKIRTPDKNE